jgi:DNA-directed RNA polymerase subunit F
MMTGERYVPLAEVKDMLEKESELRQLTPEQKIALDHSTKNLRGTKKKAEHLIKDLKDISFVSDLTAVKIADMMPTHPEDVRVLFAKERLVLDKKQIEQVIKVVEKYL